MINSNKIVQCIISICNSDPNLRVPVVLKKHFGDVAYEIFGVHSGDLDCLKQCGAERVPEVCFTLRNGHYYILHILYIFYYILRIVYFGTPPYTSMTKM